MGAREGREILARALHDKPQQTEVTSLLQLGIFLLSLAPFSSHNPLQLSASVVQLSSEYRIVPPLGAGEGIDPPLGPGEGKDPPLGAGEGIDPPLGAGEGIDPPLGAGEGDRPSIRGRRGDRPSIRARRGERPSIRGRRGDRPPLGAGGGIDPPLGRRGDRPSIRGRRGSFLPEWGCSVCQELDPPVPGSSAHQYGMVTRCLHLKQTHLHF